MAFLFFHDLIMTLIITRSPAGLVRADDDARPVPASDAFVVRRPGTRPWQTDDVDADAMATGRLHPDLQLRSR